MTGFPPPVGHLLFEERAAVVMMMVADDVVYAGFLIISLPFGHLVKLTNDAALKRMLCTSLGGLIVLLICQLHAFHSVVTTLGNCLVVRKVPVRYCHIASCVWCFGYLVFFRTTTYFGIPKPSPLANAVQLFLTLRMVGIAFDIHDSGMVVYNKNEDKNLQRECQHIQPSTTDIIAYAYNYIGLLTGPYFKYRTYYDMLHQTNASVIPTAWPVLKRLKDLPVTAACFLIFSHYFSIDYAQTDEFYERPFWFRLFYMVPMFTIFRTRLYMAWIVSECLCMSAALGAYPQSSKSKCGQGPTDFEALEKIKDTPTKDIEYDFETIHNLDIYGCELAPTTKEGLRSWNMSVQYWLANYVYRRVPVKSIRVSVTMGVSAFWHGVHPGYYLSFLTVPPILMTESLLISTFRENASPSGQRVFDWLCWFFKMRGFDYMCMGFLLLQLDATIRYWMSIYFIGHLTIIILLLVGFVFKPK